MPQPLNCVTRVSNADLGKQWHANYKLSSQERNLLSAPCKLSCAFGTEGTGLSTGMDWLPRNDFFYSASALCPQVLRLTSMPDVTTGEAYFFQLIGRFREVMWKIQTWTDPWGSATYGRIGEFAWKEE